MVYGAHMALVLLVEDDHAVRRAMTVLTLLPVTLVFAALQRYITTGVATTGMK